MEIIRLICFISVTINLLTFLRLFCPQIVRLFLNKKDGENREIRVINKLRRRKCITKANGISLLIINSSMSLIFIISAVYNIIFTSVLKKPFSTFSVSISVPIMVCLGYVLFNAFQFILCKQLNRRNCTDMIKNFTHTVILLTIVYTEENGLAGVLILFSYGSTITSEVKNVTKLCRSVNYKLVLIFDLIAQAVFNIGVPVLSYAFIVILTKEPFSTMRHASLITFGAGLLLYVIFVSFFFKHQCHLFLDEYAWSKLLETQHNWKADSHKRLISCLKTNKQKPIFFTNQKVDRKFSV
nr:uncharacterized protein LOC101241638 [Hydra vulgaris]